MDLTTQSLEGLFKERIDELQEEPEFQWSRARIQYATDEGGGPAIKVAVGNVPLDYDLWAGLRNPAVVGLYPAGLQEIWDFYANKRKESIDEGGRQTVFQVARPFDFARKSYGRAVVVSVMLPFSPEVVGSYVANVQEKRRGSSHLLRRMSQDVNLMLDKATSRVGLELVRDDRAVVVMDNATVTAVSSEAIPQTRQGASHGACKGGNFPQKSLAVLLGLGQFGIGRLVIRDEASDGRVQRFIGPLKSLIIFDKGDLVKDGSGGVIHPTAAWRDFLFRLSDFTDADQDINQYRFCPYIPHDGQSCQKCIRVCYRGAQASSAPAPSGNYAEGVHRQTHRFWDGKLQFDYARCQEEQGQMQKLFAEWSCGRCLSTCLAEGTRQAQVARGFYQKKAELTRE